MKSIRRCKNPDCPKVIINSRKRYCSDLCKYEDKIHDLTEEEIDDFWENLGKEEEVY